jgi:hypothetical protein
MVAITNACRERLTQQSPLPLTRICDFVRKRLDRLGNEDILLEGMCVYVCVCVCVRFFCVCGFLSHLCFAILYLLHTPCIPTQTSELPSTRHSWL